ncbi:caspase domain-containing protein [Altericista sp. CCNU0014]|uniref:caspase family protein n=1 Tax=Altericista sp. CCNU0014 TaxID=3082949 RepID=UPI00384A89E4
MENSETMTEPTTENSDSESRKLNAVLTESESVVRGRSLVVVIGIDDYVHCNKLKNAVQDAVGLQQTLIDKLGFSAPIPPLINEAATKAAISSLVDDQLYKVVEENDSLIVFFAGHGTTRVRKVGTNEIETGYLVPVDATQSWSEYVEIDPFLRSLSALPARHVLVILDSCESGLALGQSMQSFRDANRYTKDLSSRISRKVVTSAQRDQLANDNGPIPGHSLFTGTLIDGFNWGKADLDGNGLISSSELGLFIQQQVAQASESKQTPDFGSFHLDDRGEMVISLRNQSFDALKARAFSSLQKGEITILKELVNQLIAIKPIAPETLYIEYKLTLIENNISRAREVIEKLKELNYTEGTIPLSPNDIWNLYYNFPCWESVLAIEGNNFPVKIRVFNGKDKDELFEVDTKILGELSGYSIPINTITQFSFDTVVDYPIHIYMAEISQQGRIESILLWNYDEDTLYLENGLPCGETIKSQPFKFPGNGLSQFRFFVSPKKVNFFIYPHTGYGRGVNVSSVSEEDLKNINVHYINMFIVT